MALLSKWTCGCLEITLPQGVAIVACSHHQLKIMDVIEASPEWGKGGTSGDALDDLSPQRNSKDVIA